MGTVSYFVDKKPACIGVGTHFQVAESVIDFAKKPVLAADVVRVMNIPKGAYVLNVLITV